MSRNLGIGGLFVKYIYALLLAFLTGRRRALTPEAAEKLAHAAGVAVEKLFDGTRELK